MENGNSGQRKSRVSKEAKVKARERIRKTSDAISRADDYCERIRNRELTITHDAENVKLTIYEGTDYLGRPKKQEYTLAFLIAKRMTEYQSIRDSSQLRIPPHMKTLTPEYHMLAKNIFRITAELLRARALDLLEVMDQANTHGAIKDENLWNQLEECQEQNEQLREKVDKLEKENQKLHTSLKNFGKVGFVSDVMDEREDKP